MARNPRQDEPGSWHHVMNRGIARRSLFESRADVRFFVACLAHAVRRGQIEVHAWSVLTTHFHLLVRSPIGELSCAMRRVQLAYVRRFNRGRRRDGPLVRGRFRSKPVTSLTYREVLVRYIDQNPVVAGLAARPELYRHGSAHAYARESGPPWLTRDWIEALVCGRLGLGRYEGRSYPRAFTSGDAHADRSLVERRMALPGNDSEADDLDHLIDAAPARVLAWLRRKAALADGSEPGLPVADPDAVRSSIQRQRKERGDWSLVIGRRARSGWQLLEAGLLRDLTSAKYEEIGSRLDRSAVTASRLCQKHHLLVRNDAHYAAVAADVMRRVFTRVPAR
ncbi:MAG: transposase [Planctomycetota bacterium]|nr:transposase [Planctomycetota bacterium]